MEHFAIEYCPPTHSKTESLYFPDRDDHIVNVIRRTRTFYESDLLEHLWFAVPRKGVFVDVGANIGNHTVFFAKYMASFVVAIEPHPDNYEILNSVVAKNELTNVVTVETAAGCEKGVATLSLPEEFEGNAGSYSISSGSAGRDPVQISIDSLDAILSQHVEDQTQGITLMKIDVEGHEEHVLEGARRILETHRPHLIIEIHSTEQQNAIENQLRPLGYRVIGQFCASPTYHFAAWSGTRYASWRLRRKLSSAARRLQRLGKKLCRQSGLRKVS